MENKREKKTEKQNPVVNIHDFARSVGVDSTRLVDNGNADGSLDKVFIKRRGDLSKWFSKDTTISYNEEFLFGANSMADDMVVFLKCAEFVINDKEAGKTWDFADMSTLDGLHRFAIKELFLVIAAFLDPDNHIL